MSSTLDPITLEVLTQALIATVREMRATVFRTARSVAITEAKDFSCGLFDPQAQVVAQSEDIGSHVVPLPWSDAEAVDPEEAFVAALSSCHMLWFLDIACRGARIRASWPRRGSAWTS